MDMLSILIVIYLWLSLQQIPSGYLGCNFDDAIGLVCVNELFYPDSLLESDVGFPRGIFLLNITSPVHLSLPWKDPVNQYTVFDSFIIEHSCLINISSSFFLGLGPIKRIKFTNISCLKRLASDSFGGLGNTLTVLMLEMPDLESIEDDFFHHLSSIISLHITMSKLKTMPPDIFKYGRLRSVHLDWNQLNSLPDYPNMKVEFSEDFSALGNRFICDCRLREYVADINDKEFFKSRCDHPPELRGKDFCYIASMCDNGNHSLEGHKYQRKCVQVVTTPSTEPITFTRTRIPRKPLTDATVRENFNISIDPIRTNHSRSQEPGHGTHSISEIVTYIITVMSVIALLGSIVLVICGHESHIHDISTIALIKKQTKCVVDEELRI